MWISKEKYESLKREAQCERKECTNYIILIQDAVRLLQDKYNHKLIFESERNDYVSWLRQAIKEYQEEERVKWLAIDVERGKRLLKKQKDNKNAS